MRWRYYISEDTLVHRNQALEEVLLRNVNEDQPVIFLWQNSRAIVIGRNQNLNAECRVTEFIELGGQIARRRSGGGAVYHDLGNLNVSLICADSDLPDINFNDLILEALKTYGIEGSFSGRNDITVDNRKVCGTAEYQGSGKTCIHGCVLIDVDIGAMSHFLTPDVSKLERHQVRSVDSRVMNLIEVCEDISVERFKNELVKCVNAEPLSVPEAMKDEVKKVQELYSSKDWIERGIRG